MSGDIDIEEHDLMDNPRVRTIFPDLTLLKKEIVDPNHEELQNKNQGITNDSVVPYIKEELTAEENLIRPPSWSAEIKKSKNSLLKSNVIVFGTKPSTNSDKKLKYNVKINLKDINFYLKKSKRYCRICKTLFPKIKMIEEHNIFIHKDTFNNTKDSIGGQEENVRDSLVNISEGNLTNKCFHCREIFSTQELLIEHLYEVLDKKVKMRQSILVNESEVKSNVYQNSQQDFVFKKTVEKNIDKAKCTTKYPDTNCITETISLNTCETISIEGESCSESDNQIEIICDTNRNEALQCNICSYYFLQQRFYEVHMERKHKTKVKVKQSNVVKFNPKCVFCSNIYPSLKKYNSHLHHAHPSMIFDTTAKELKVNTYIDKIKKSNEDNSSNFLATQQQNTTLLSLESSYDMINDNPIHFKSVLFKCLKCEIHFLSPKLATSHIIHSEILINWKCSLCKMFFKRSDEDSHLKQHKYTKSFTVVDVEDKDLRRIMIKCAKCPLHVSNNDFRHHITVCGASINSWHCFVCDIHIDGNINNKRAHNTIHSDTDNQKSDFIIINDSIINSQVYSRNVIQDLDSKEDITSISSSVESNGSEIDNYSPDESNGYSLFDDSIPKTQKSYQLKGSLIVKNMSTLNNKSVTKDRSQKSTVNDKSITEDGLSEQKKLKRKVDEVSDPSKNLRRKLLKRCSANDDSYSKFIFKPPDRPTFLLNLTYCKNCECFINFYFRLDVHLQNRCNNLSKRVCNICGIVFTPKIIVRHKEFHELNPHLKLQDFRFYDIETCQQILPPIPIYPKCNICEAYFVSKDEIRCHTCIETPSLYCDICEEKFASEEALNLHIPFHGYYIQSKSSIEHNSPYKRDPAVSNENNRNLNSLLMESLEESHNKDYDKNKCENNTAEVYKPQLSEYDELHPVADEKKTSLSQENSTKYVKQDNIEEKYYLYTCEICNVTVCHYDQLVEHCHSHYNNSYKNISTEKCTQCNLVFDRSFMSSHKEMHKTGLSNESFEIFVCDLFHFGRSNAEWLNHVFKSLPKSKRENIIKYAIYKNECRIKLDIAQQGDPELTLYQCTKCSIFIDDSDIFTHREKCMGSNKKYPCHSCGIALLSEGHRTRHLELHEQRSLSINSYRIVVFNRLKDKALNESMFNKTNQYVIYKCRNCHGIVEWRILKNHHCNFNDLKKCHKCGLLIYNKDYVKHENKHNTCDTFIASNMKVVMFGQIRQESKNNNDIACSFSGIASDYILYKCNKCDVCIRHLRLSSRHFCLIDAGKWKCSRCLLFFDEGQKKSHRAMHVSDTEFTSDAICVIPFDPQETYQRLKKEIKSKVKHGDREKESEEILINVSIQEKTDILYRCPCGLHYLSEGNAREHVKRNKCGVILKKNLIQTCSKCSLNFTPEILYKHLLQHHAEKYIKYSFDIVNIDEKRIK